MADPNWKNRTLWTGDNLDILRGMNSESVDLIYLDPPFNSNQQYAAPIGSKAAGAAFKDTWTLSDVDEAWHGEIADKDPTLYAIIDAAGLAHGKSMKSYLIMMAVRLLEMKRILKLTGSLYLHCDSTASHYLKTLMDAIFGAKNFRNDVTWRRTSAHNDATYFGRVTDNLLYYGASAKAFFHNRQYQPHSEKYKSKYRYNDQDGRGLYRKGDLTGPNPSNGESGQPWRGYDPTTVGRHWSAPKTGGYVAWIEQNTIPEYRSIVGVHARLEALQQADMVKWTENGLPELKRYLASSLGTSIPCHWSDISPVNSQSKNATKYPTQKPLALLERIIQASSNKGDLILDPFCGCATACVAAEKLGRQWVGIDLSPVAATLVKSRLKDEMGLFYDVQHRTDIPHRTDLGKLPSYKTHKHTLFGKQEGRCAGCQIFFPFQNFTIDHIIPQSKGGTDHLDNLQLLCNACNSLKGNRDHAYLVAELKKRDRLYTEKGDTP